MEAQEFWTELFVGRAADGLESAHSEDAVLILAAAHRSQYGNYLGSSKLCSAGLGYVWTFTQCEHGDQQGICDAHQGFLRGTLAGLNFKNVRVERDWSNCICRLCICWEKA